MIPNPPRTACRQGSGSERLNSERACTGPVDLDRHAVAADVLGQAAGVEESVGLEKMARAMPVGW